MKKNKPFPIVFKTVLFAFFISNLNAQIVITIQPGPAEGKDAEVWTINPNANNGDCMYFKANAWTWGGTFGIERTYFEFDLSEIPPDATILEATLSMYYHYLPGNPEQTHYGSNEALLKQVTSAWEEFNITWNSQPNTTTENQVLIPASAGPQEDYLDIDVKNMVINMIENPEESFGFLLRLFEEDTYRRIGLASSDHPDPAKWPLLTVIIECEMPVADFTIEDMGGYVQFYDNSTGATSWDWDFGDGYGSSLQNPVHAYLESGIFQVCLTVTNDCGSDTHCDTVRPVLTEVNRIESNHFELNIIPNPVSNYLGVNLTSPSTEVFEFAIIDITGRCIQNRSEFISSGKNSLQIDLRAFEKGLYLLQAKTSNYIAVKRFILE